MNYIEDIEDKVKSFVNVFRDHKAELTQCGTLSALDWRRPGTGVYAVRFVFDSDRYNDAVYITGDFGQAVILPTCRARLREMAIWFTSRTDKLNVNVGYFMEKMATSGDRYEWTRNDWIEDFKKHCEDYGLIPPEDFIDDVEGIWSSSVEFYDDQPPRISEKARKDLEKMDPDYWEWVYDCGKRVDARVIAWLVALRLAYEQTECKADSE
ncbi:MAG: hypothetical protein IKF72_14370 [Kiritimatiellae bacterium]|nr:hypothetical protein [Kiritimatiellia bacterium]